MNVRIAGLLLAVITVVVVSSATRAQSGPTDPAFFATKLYPVLQEARCSGCHAQDGVASATRLHFPAKDATQAQIEDFGLSLSLLVDRTDASNSLLLRKPTKTIPHTGGERIHPGSDEEKLLKQWVQYLASSSDEQLAAVRKSLGDTSEAGPKELVRRLTHSQYNNTVRDLLADYSQPANRFPEEDYVDGFKNQLTAQGMPPLLVETYSTSADKLALNAFRIGDVNGLIPCKPSSAADDKCRDAFIRQFGLKAFRRPLTADEQQRYGALFSAQAKTTRKFLEGARAVVEAMLQSPNFLFHVEGGLDGKAVDYDAASRLSYMLWNTMPDAALFEAAAKGELHTADGRMKAARRMIDDPRSRQALDEFFDEWLRFDKVVNAVKERQQYPDFTPELAAAMAEETRTLLQHLAWDDKNFMEALTADYSYLTTDLASLYKVPAPQGEFEMVKFPASAHRAGILGQGSFLASTAGPTATSPTARGIFIRERLLCQHVPPPPPGVNTTLPEPSSPDTARTRRQLMTAHVENATCASCHRLMDPIGFGLESFDAIGAWREKETVRLPATGEGEARRRARDLKLDIETQGEIAGIPNSAFSDAKQLGTILAASPVCQKCMVRQMFRYSYGRLETAGDEPAIDAIFAKFKDSSFRFKAILLGLVESPEFLGR
jgi:Protein of unknown function (DUF1592)/Protein of unknown function (DUF1588)/Protein of unknown function (DUF1595)/Protein of unknown function (DUF1587)/Protein of unknown function (DUF1585)